MQRYQIISDGACDLNKEQIRDNDLKVVPFYVSFDNKNYLKVGEDIEVREFYQRMVDNPKVFPKTSMPSSQDYVDAFMPFIKEDIPIICFCISSKMSGSYNSANVAKLECLESFPNAKITIINSIAITVIQGLLVLETARMKRNGLSYEEAIDAVERIKQTSRILFTVDDLEYLKHGGRIGKLTYIIGSALKIKPLIEFKEGEIFSAGKAIGRKRSILKVIEQTIKHIENLNEKPQNYLYGIGSGFAYEEGFTFREKLIQAFNLDNIEKNMFNFQIGSTIAAHTGPYSIGVGFLKKYDA